MQPAESVMHQRQRAPALVGERGVHATSMFARIVREERAEARVASAPKHSTASE